MRNLSQADSTPPAPKFVICLRYPERFPSQGIFYFAQSRKEAEFLYNNPLRLSVPVRNFFTLRWIFSAYYYWKVIGSTCTFSCPTSRLSMETSSGQYWVVKLGNSTR
jgi:hypothetical protein